MKVGTIVKLKVSCLGNETDTLGVVFNTYPDFDDKSKKGVQVIFENGEYDGFSFREQETFLKYVGFSHNHENYIFKNVIQVSRDFDNGHWDTVLKNNLLKY